jgi:type VI secretion system protein ImpH
MATPGGPTPDPLTNPALPTADVPPPAGVKAPLRTVKARTIEELLFSEGFGFDFFQAVRLLERMAPERRPVGRVAPPHVEAVRFKALPSLSFPPSQIFEINRPTTSLPAPAMTVTFMGLTGPNGALPRHYTELLLKLQRDAKGPEKQALREWLDMFNNRAIALFYRAWEKYRFYIGYERDTRPGGKGLDTFTRCLFSFIGLREPPLRNRLRVARRVPDNEEQPAETFAAVEDLALLHYGGLLSHRPRCAIGLEAILHDYFQQNVRALQFHGQWLVLNRDNQSRLGAGEANNQLGVSVVIGERVWDVQSKIRIRLGPLRYKEFNEFLPDRSAVAQRKAFFLLAHLVRLYVGAELDFDVQLVLRGPDVPACQFVADGIGPRLGWNTWVISRSLEHDADDAVFEGEEVVYLN